MKLLNTMMLSKLIPTVLLAALAATAASPAAYAWTGKPAQKSDEAEEQQEVEPLEKTQSGESAESPSQMDEEILPIELGVGLGLAQYTSVSSIEGYRGSSDINGLAAQGEATVGYNPSRYLRLGALAAGNICFDNQSGYCPSFTQFSLSHGHTLRARFGHVSVDYGLAAGYSELTAGSAVEEEYADEFMFGATGSLEAYTTPLPFLGIGVEIPVSVNNRYVGASALLSLKLGRLAPF